MDGCSTLPYHESMSTASNPIVLASDIGATNARFALVENPLGEARVVFQRIYPTASFPDFEPAIQTFLREAGCTPSLAAIAIAGPVDDTSARLTNRAHWTVDRSWFARQGIHATILNDFQALAYGLTRAGPDDYVVLQPGNPAQGGVMAAVGAGTGLGVSALFWDGQRYRTFPSEGGHISFAPRTQKELELFHYLQTRHGRVSAERVICGAGLVAVYDFLRQQCPQAEPISEPAEVSRRALADPDSLPARALDLFVGCYGAFAGDIALTFMARGGLYVAGGIAAKLAPRLARGDFLEAFNAKGRMRRVTETIPVRIVTNELMGLMGAAYAALE